jgi:ATP-dependent helicase/nuclease subunit A
MSKRQFKEIPKETIAQTGRATDPASSVWVSANAGSGKTHVLSERVIRLLLGGVDPSAIVCLTYTKAAAAVMKNRVFERLAAWTSLSGEKLAEAVEKLDGRAPDAARLVMARRLFARALETPGGLKIQTIHSFCQMILGRFPLEANIAGRFELIDDALSAQIVKDARRAVLQSAGRPDSAVLAQAVRQVAGSLGEHALDALLDETLTSRSRPALADFCRSVAAGSESRRLLFEFLGVEESETEAGIISAAWPLKCASPALLQSMRDVAAASRLVAQTQFAGRISAVLANTDPLRRFECLKELTQTANGERRKFSQILKGDLLGRFPNLEEIIEALADEIDAVGDHLIRLKTALFSVQGFTIASAALDAFAEHKARRAVLDHDDVIDRTAKLLTESGAGAWVQYKLDQGISHILVDEAQDTSPAQWQVINALAEEFFTGETARGGVRTLFAVGDEKQSIYSFQGARPEIFAHTGRRTRRKALDSNRKFDEAKLNLSFRSTADVLSAVDLVFAQPENQRGLTAGGDYQTHEPIRVHGPGRVEHWPCVNPLEKEEIPESWTQGQRHETAPPARLAASIAKTIADWLKSGAANEASGAKIRPKDIMVLVRKRGPFVHALSRELKNRGIAVSGADRLTLTDHIAVKDLLAIARVCLLTEDDLSLASLLRSPLFAFSDGELLQLAAYREPGESLYDRMRRSAADAGQTAKALETLDRWRKEAASSAVFDFFARILSRDRVRARLIQRLGVEAGDVIDEFLNYAAASEKAGLGGLQDFVETLESAAPEVKREMDAGRDEVRIMTAHAAKGQESPIVFLVHPPAQAHKPPKLVQTSAKPPVFVWEPLAELRSSKTEARHAELSRRGEDELRRLLYVGMTRAEDRLIICGFANSRPVKTVPNWIDMAEAGLLARPDRIKSEWQPHLDAEIKVYQLSGQAAVPHAMADGAEAELDPMPEAFSRPLPPVSLVPRPLSPSSAALMVEPDAEPEAGSPVLDAGGSSASAAIQRGLITHKLLEVLPGIPESERRAAAARYLSRTAGGLAEAERAAISASVFAVLDNPDFAPVFASGSRAEVSLMGRLIVKGQERIISGKIDRIAVDAGRVLIVDYKTGAPPSIMPKPYVTQMALYRALIGQIYPGREVEAALLFTASATLHSLPGPMLNAALEALTDS